MSRTLAESKLFAHLLISSSSLSKTIIENLQTATSLVADARESYWRSATAEMIGGVVIILAREGPCWTPLFHHNHHASACHF